MNVSSSRFVESKTRTYHGGVGSGRTAGWRGGVGQDWMPRELFAQETSLPRPFQSIADTAPERHPRRTDKRNPIQTDGGTKSPVDSRFITGSSGGHPRFISGTRNALSSWLLTSVPSPICLCKPFSCKPEIPGHALHDRGLQKQIGVGTLVSSQERRALFVPVINR